MEQLTPLEQLICLLNPYARWFHEHIPAERHERYAQIVLLRETKSHAIFTTTGRMLDAERLQAGADHTHPVDRVVMYKRKQIAPERRKGRALLRDLGILTDVVIGTDSRGKPKTKQRSDCQLMGNSCGYCPDCILYGYAATTGAGSQKSRVLTDSGFLVRDRFQTMRDIHLNAIQDTTAGGIAGSAFSSRENVLPQVFLPTVETLVDVTVPEFLYVLGNILRTMRYGAESGREGFVRNHLLGVYFSDSELFSNLELTQFYYDALAEAVREELPDTDPLKDPAKAKPPDYLSPVDFTVHWPQVEQHALSLLVGRYQKLDELELDGLRKGMQALYADEAALRALLAALDEKTLQYALTVKPGAGKKARRAMGGEVDDTAAMAEVEEAGGEGAEADETGELVEIDELDLEDAGEDDTEEI
jgi:CRISPR-associated protein Csc2